jgi:hypothetical protein
VVGDRYPPASIKEPLACMAGYGLYGLQTPNRLVDGMYENVTCMQVVTDICEM